MPRSIWHRPCCWCATRSRSTSRRRRRRAAQLEQLVTSIEQALWGIDFFKAHLATGMMRSVRRLIYRAAPTAREAALLTAMCRETLNALRRRDARPD